jgi:DNA modification methylase
MHADVLEGLKRIPDASVHLIFSSPPYNVGLEGYKNRNL